MPQQQDPSFGPFTDILSTPLYQQNGGPAAPSGFGGKGENSLFFVDKFLEGMQRGRQMQFERHEHDQQKLYNSILDAYARVDQADVPQDVKEKARGQLDALRIGVMAKHVDDATGKGGGKKGEGQSKEQKMLHFIKSGLDAMMGPRPKQYEMGQEQINNGLNQVFSAITDPQNNVQNRLAESDKNFMSLYHAKSQAAGRPLTQAEVSADPAMNQMLAYQGKLTGGKSLGMGTSQLLAGLEPGTKEAKLNEEVKQSQIDYNRSRAKYDEAVSKDEYESYVNGKGQPLRWNKTQGRYVDDQNKPISSDDERLIGARPSSKAAGGPKGFSPPFADDETHTLMHTSKETGQTETIINPLNGRPVHKDSALGRQMIMEGVREANREKNIALHTEEGYDRTISTLKKVKGYEHNPTLQAEVARLEQEKRAAGERVDELTPTPPGGKKEKKQKQQEDSDLKLLQQLMGGGVPSPPPATGDRGKGWGADQ